MPSFGGGISSPSGTKFGHKKLETLGYHMVKTRVSISLGLASVPGRHGHQEEHSHLGDKQTGRKTFRRQSISVTDECETLERPGDTRLDEWVTD